MLLLSLREPWLTKGYAGAPLDDDATFENKKLKSFSNSQKVDFAFVISFHSFLFILINQYLNLHKLYFEYDMEYFEGIPRIAY